MEIMKFARQLIGKLPFFSDESEKVKVKKEITIVGGLESTASAEASYPRPIKVDDSGNVHTMLAEENIVDESHQTGLAGNAGSTAIGSASEIWQIDSIPYKAAAARAELVIADAAAGEAQIIAYSNFGAAGTANIASTSGPVKIPGATQIFIQGGDPADVWSINATRVKIA